MSIPEHITFRSKKGYGLLIPITLLLAGIMMWLVMENTDAFSLLVVGSINLATLVLVFYFALSTKYSIVNGQFLLIKSGFLSTQKISIDSITKVKKSRSLWASAAPSINRLEVFFGKYDSVLISPNEQKLFVEGLQKINPKIESDVA